MKIRILNRAFAGSAFLLTAGYAAYPVPDGGQAQAQLKSRTAVNQPAAAETSKLPPMVRNGLPGAMHQHLNALLGDWRVEMMLYIAGGTPKKPVISRDLTCHREWIAETGNRYIKDVTEGSVGGGRYYRMGLLGYSSIDKKYEWVTVDALNANMMIYRGRARDSSRDISMTGDFTDQGVLGEVYVGKRVGMRTVIRIESTERNVFELYVTPPKRREFLAARAIYTRAK